MGDTMSRRNARGGKPVPLQVSIPTNVGTARVRNASDTHGLFRAELALSGARNVGAIGSTERSVGGGAGVHVAMHRWFRRRNRSRWRWLRGRTGGGWCIRGSGRKAGRNDRRANVCIRGGRHISRRRCMQSGFGVGHWRHRSGQPVDPQQYAAKGNDQHRAIDRKPHRAPPAGNEPIPNTRAEQPCRTAAANIRGPPAKYRDIVQGLRR